MVISVHRWGRLAYVLIGLLLASAAVLLSASDADANNLVQGLVVSDDPVDFTPNILDGRVNAITTVGDRVIVGGTFTQVRQVGDPSVVNGRIVDYGTHDELVRRGGLYYALYELHRRRLRRPSKATEA